MPLGQQEKTEASNEGSVHAETVFDVPQVQRLIVEMKRYQLWMEGIGESFTELRTTCESYNILNGSFSPVYLSVLSEFYMDFQGSMKSELKRGQMISLKVDAEYGNERQHYEYYDFDESIYIRYQMGDIGRQHFPVYINCSKTLRYYYYQEE